MNREARRYSCGGVGPEGRVVRQYLGRGGRVLIGTSSATRSLWDTPLYRDIFGVDYERSWNRGFRFNLAGVKENPKEGKYEIEPARPGESITIMTVRPNMAGVTPFVTLSDGQCIGVKIDRQHPATGASFRAIVLGFYLSDIKSEESRRAVLKEALEFLEGSVSVLAESKSS